MAPANSSHTSARPEPLCSPKGSTTPRGSVYMTEGSVVGLPAWSSNAPSSIGLPALCATRTFPMATRLVAKSSRIGSLLLVPGMAMQTGLVRNRPSRPRKGATAGRARSDVDEVQRHHAGPRGNLAIGADAADMVRIAQPVHRDAMLLRRLDRPFDRLAGDHLAVAGPRIPYRDRAGVRDDLRRLVDLERASLEVAHIGDQHSHAMAVMAAQVCLDQMLGNDGRLGRRTATRRDDAVRKRTQPDVVDNHVASLLTRWIGYSIARSAMLALIDF